MKWSELTWKERKQIYDTVRADNPNASYLDIKQQFDNIPEYENGEEHEVAASYSLPEINIYPQNQFGDIARSQGYNTAKAWKEVKEGTTSGINAFANDPRTQFVTGVLPLPSGIEGISEVGNLLKTSKRIENKFQKNIGNYVSNFLKETSLNSLLGNSFSARRKYLTEAYNAANAAVHDVKIINNVADKNYRKYMLDNNKTIYFTEDFDKNSKIPIKIHGKNSNKLFEKNVSGVYDPDKQRIDLRGLNGSYIKYRTPPSVIRANAAHEIQHWAENYIADGDVSKWDGFSKYYVPNEDNWIGNAFKKVLSGKPGDWIYSPAEVLAERAALMDKYRMPISTNKNATDFLLRRFEISAKNKNGFLNLLNQLDSMQFPDGGFKVKKTINKVNQKTPAFENGKEGNLKLPIEYAVPLTIADLANTNNTNNN